MFNTRPTHALLLAPEVSLAPQFSPTPVPRSWLRSRSRRARPRAPGSRRSRLLPATELSVREMRAPPFPFHSFPWFFSPLITPSILGRQQEEPRSQRPHLRHSHHRDPAAAKFLARIGAARIWLSPRRPNPGLAMDAPPCGGAPRPRTESLAVASASFGASMDAK